MRRFLLSSMIVLLSLNCLGQSNRVYLTDVKIKYDSDFDPYVELTIHNSTSKEITSIEFYVNYNKNNPFDYISVEVVTVQQSLGPNRKVTRTFYVPRHAFDPYSVSIKRVRFSDGTVLE